MYAIFELQIIREYSPEQVVFNEMDITFVRMCKFYMK
jgi:hypothetical protein